jgi:UPF0271 protein
MATTSIDLNCDMGESFGAYKLGMDASVIAYISSANIACGWHAGDPMVMDRTIRMAKEHGVSPGAHPGYPDLMGFGRREMALSREEIRAYMIYQIGALQGFCAAHGLKLRHVKPHGSLYLSAVANEAVARGIAEAITAVDPDLYYMALAGQKGELVAGIGKEMGLKVIREAFPDRAYTPDGTLVPRSQAGAVIKDPAEVAARALLMAGEGVVVAVDGKRIPLKAQTLCVHGDTPGAVDLVRQIRQTLEKENIRVAPFAGGR